MAGAEKVRAIRAVGSVGEVTLHHDGHGLNESIVLQHDAPDPVNGQAPHHYAMTIGGELVANIHFQHGPRNGPDSRPGVTEAAVLAVLIDRLEHFQAGPFACDENAQQIGHLRAALALTRARADARAARGVLGKLEK